MNNIVAMNNTKFVYHGGEHTLIIIICYYY